MIAIFSNNWWLVSEKERKLFYVVMGFYVFFQQSVQYIILCFRSRHYFHVDLCMHILLLIEELYNWSVLYFNKLYMFVGQEYFFFQLRKRERELCLLNYIDVTDLYASSIDNLNCYQGYA